MNKNPENIMSNISFEDFTAVCGDFKLKGISPILDVPMSYDIDAMFKGWNLSDTPSDWVFAGLLGGSVRIKGFATKSGLDVSDGNVPFITMKNTRSEDVKIDSLSKIKDLAPAETNKAKVIMETVDSAPTWLSYLIACVQTKPLASKSMMSFFISLKVDVPNLTHTKRFLDYISPMMPTFMDKKEFREIALNNRFMQYHTAVCSTPTLAKRVIEDLKDLASSFFTDSDIRYVADAYLHFWDMEKANLIPQRVIAITMAYLRATKSEPDKWYQGEKAADAMGGNFMREHRDLFELILEKSSATKDLKDAKSFDDLTRGIRSSKPEARGYTPIDEVLRELRNSETGVPPSGRKDEDIETIMMNIHYYVYSTISPEDRKKFELKAKPIVVGASGLPNDLKEILENDREVTDYDAFLFYRYADRIDSMTHRGKLLKKIKDYVDSKSEDAE